MYLPNYSISLSIREEEKLSLKKTNQEQGKKTTGKMARFFYGTISPGIAWLGKRSNEEMGDNTESIAPERNHNRGSTYNIGKLGKSQKDIFRDWSQSVRPFIQL